MFDIDQFEDDAKENGIRYWYAHEFMVKLGYESWPSFKAVILKAMGSCLNLGIDTDEAFTPVELDSVGKSYKLTRFACFLIAMQADSKKPEVAKAQVALAAIAEALVSEKLAQSGIERLDERVKLTGIEKHLSGVAQKAGITEHWQFAVFKDSGFRGMYNMPLQQLKSYKGAPEGKTLYDFMGVVELAANTFRVTQTAERMRSNNVQGLDNASETAREVGKEVRDIMLRSSGGVAPEDIALEGDIKDVKRQIKTTRKAMNKLDKVCHNKEGSRKKK